MTKLFALTLLAGTVAASGLAHADHETVEASSSTKLFETNAGPTDGDDVVPVTSTAKFDTLELRIWNNDLHVQGVAITFADGEIYDPHIDRLVRDGATVRIELPGRARAITQISLDWGERDRRAEDNINSRLTVYASTEARRDRDDRSDTWRGSHDDTVRMIARAEADARRGAVTFQIARRDRNADLRVLTSDSRLRIRSVELTFARGRSIMLRPQSGSLDELDLGNHRRGLRSVTVTYVNRNRDRDGEIALVAGGGRASRR